MSSETRRKQQRSRDSACEREYSSPSAYIRVSSLPLLHTSILFHSSPTSRDDQLSNISSHSLELAVVDSASRIGFPSSPSPCPSTYPTPPREIDRILESCVCHRENRAVRSIAGSSCPSRMTSIAFERREAEIVNNGVMTMIPTSSRS